LILYCGRPSVCDPYHTQERQQTQDGCDAVTVQRDLMRHASIQTTMNVYGRATMSEAKRQANSKVGRMASKPFMPGKNEGELGFAISLAIPIAG